MYRNRGKQHRRHTDSSHLQPVNSYLANRGSLFQHLHNTIGNQTTSWLLHEEKGSNIFSEHPNYAGNRTKEREEQRLSVKGGKGNRITFPFFLETSPHIRASHGTRIESSVLGPMENKFGQDFSDVRVQRSNTRARNEGALAFTTGNEIILGEEAPNLHDVKGKLLLAHELAHVLQFRESRRRGLRPSGRSSSSDPAELQAHSMAQKVGQGHRVASTPIQAASSAVHALDISPVEPITTYLPDEAELAAELGAVSAAARATRVTAYRDQVATTWARANAAGLLPDLGRVRAREGEMATSAVQPTPGLSDSRPTFYREHLMLDAGLTTGNRVGRDLVIRAIMPASVSGTGARAANAIVQLRRLDDVLRRALTAQSVSTATGIPIEEVLAMYRVEGDMAMPPSRASLAAGIPAGRTDAATSLNPTPDISHLVVAIDPVRVSGWTDDKIKEFGLTVWFVQIGGLDQVGGLPYPREGPFATWSNNNWRRAGRTTDTLAAARLRWSNAKTTVDVVRQPSAGGGSTAVLAQVNNPEALVAAVLTEAALLHKRLRSIEDFLGPLPAGHARAGTELSSAMGYLRYHAGTGNMQSIVLSGLVGASRAAGTPIRMAIDADVALSAIVTLLRATIAGMDGAAVQAAAITAWPTINTWMAAPGNMELMSTFIETAGAGEWSGWGEHRGNLSRYRVLTEYYRGL